MTRVIRFHRTGGPKVLQIEVEAPRPSAGEVLIRMHALGLNRAEAMYREGRYVIAPRLPARLGYEGAGEITALHVIGSNLSDLNETAVGGDEGHPDCGGIGPRQ